MEQQENTQQRLAPTNDEADAPIAADPTREWDRVPFDDVDGAGMPY